jgi:hypothetical protein
VSQRHASLRQRGSEYVIVDEGSENGTFLGATRLTKHAPHPLASGDLLRFGRVWVEVRLGPADHPIEVQASRELARRLVDAALEADAQPNGMIVSAEGADHSLRLTEPRRPYLVGSKKGADLRIADLPSRCLELRRQADQLWVTLLGKTEAAFGERALVEGERTAWPKSALLSLGDVRLVVTDPTAGVLEQLEQGRTERMADGAMIDPPSRDDEDEDEEDAEEGGEDWAEAENDDSGDAADHGATAGDTAPLASRTPPRAKTSRSGWSRADAIVLFLAIGVLALSLWAIRWLAQAGSA